MLTKKELSQLEQGILSSSYDYTDLKKVVVSGNQNGFEVTLTPDDGPEEKYSFLYAGDDTGPGNPGRGPRRTLVTMQHRNNENGWLMQLTPNLLFAAMFAGNA